MVSLWVNGGDLTLFDALCGDIEFPQSRSYLGFVDRYPVANVAESRRTRTDDGFAVETRRLPMVCVRLTPPFRYMLNFRMTSMTQTHKEEINCAAVVLLA